MKKLLLIFLISTTTYAQFELYQYSFDRYYNVESNTKIEFGRFLGDATAVSIHGRNHVVIDENRWNKLTKIEKYYVIYHELGHAYFKMKHSRGGLMKPKTPKQESIYFSFQRGRKKLKEKLNE